MKKVFMLMVAAGAISLAACGGGKDKDSSDGGSNSGSDDAWGACDCLRKLSKKAEEFEANPDESQNIVKDVERELNAHCSAYMDESGSWRSISMGQKLSEACSKEAEEKRNAASGQQDPSAGNKDGDICDCLMAAKSIEDAEACDKSKSLGEINRMMNDCMKSKKLER